ncbi:unnamed protein product [Danaus chrysippus]|uniref:(African queen) hypothetical protein n=1 Tax=Danaus chrysippus TaxID=151541 RepID=A0A8J2QKA2_9NEOP|nr:unnamed protein product [Danaus chrysippus]
MDTDDDQKMAMLRKAFQMFDTTKSGYIDVLKISTILNTMGQLFDDSELQALIDENDPESTGKINFDGFCNIASHFLEEEDAEAMQQELKEAFRLYDREGNGYITTSTLKEILAALDDKLSNADLDGIIAEIDTDGSGTVDFDEVAFNDETYIKYIVPSGYSPQKSQKQSKLELLDFANKDNEHYETLKKHILAGTIKNGLTFNIYDDNMREATIALFRLLQYSEKEQINTIKEWAFENINHDIIDYAGRLVSLYRTDVIKEQEPPYVSKPNYFINSEVIYKALKLKINNGKFDSQTASVQQFYRTDDVITINANYSGWNLLNEDCNDKLDYFREDIGLNSYYYGVHLQYPFWMNNDELTGIDPKYAEQYYYIHKQLMARYNLEKQHPDYKNSQFESKCYDDYIPYLVHDNGLNFAVRSTIKKENSEEYARLKSVDIAIRECIARGFIYMVLFKVGKEAI